MRITEILSKPVISLLNSRTEGIVKSVIFDKNFKKAKWIVLFDNNEHLEEKALNVCDIYSLGENAIIIKNEECLNLEISCIKSDEKPLPINNNVYTTQGKYLGKVIDIIIDEKYNIINLILNNSTEILTSKIVASGEDAVIVQDGTSTVNISALKRKKNKPLIKDIEIKTEQKVEILNSNEEKKEISETIKNEENINDLEKLTNLNENALEVKEAELPKPTKKYTLNENSTPQTLSVNEKILLNRKIEKNIYSQNKELIARKNARISQETINKAKLFCKLRELIKYSK